MAVNYNKENTCIDNLTWLDFLSMLILYLAWQKPFDAWSMALCTEGRQHLAKMANHQTPQISIHVWCYADIKQEKYPRSCLINITIMKYDNAQYHTYTSRTTMSNELLLIKINTGVARTW